MCFKTKWNEVLKTILTTNNINSRLDQLSRSAIRKIVKQLFYMRVLSSSLINRLNGRNVREPDVLLRTHAVHAS